MVSSLVRTALTIISIIIVAYVLFLIFQKISNDASSSGPRDIGAIVPSLALFPFLKSRKKGIELTVNLVATIILVLVVALMLFLLFAGVAAESGSSSGNFFYSIFDSIIRSLPLVGG